MSVMSTEQLLIPELLVVDVTEIECVWKGCTREGLFAPVLTVQCGCPLLPHCIPHMDEINAMQAANADHPSGWMCSGCYQTVGFIVRWERVR